MPKILLLVVLALGGCAKSELRSLKAEIDMSPVDCGYKWFQSGYSPDIYIECELNRDHLQPEQTALAIDHAWSIANTRCPIKCPPRELKDTVEWENPSPDGVCRDGVIYFYSRLFFQCGM